MAHSKKNPVKLFLPQKTLEDWAIADEADLVDGKVVVTKTKSTHSVVPAVHFMKLVSGGEDSNDLVGRVKTVEQLDALGAEHMMDSVILGETAYEVSPGYIAEVRPPGPAPKQDKKKASSPEADLLAAFILDKL